MNSTTTQRLITIGEISRGIVEVAMHDTLHQLLRKINWNENSCVAVLDDNKDIFGILTDQLINYAVKKKLSIHTTYAWEIASPVFKKATPNTTLQEAIELMIQHQVRYLIVEENGNVTGMVTPLHILSLINWDEERDITVPGNKS